MGVVSSHAAQNLDYFAVTQNMSQHFSVGWAGVDLFFVISGFVLVYTSEPLFGSLNGALTFFATGLSASFRFIGWLPPFTLPSQS